MTRRTLLHSLGLPALLRAQQGPPKEERVESLTAPAKPSIALNHLGFLPKSKKQVIFRLTGGTVPSEFNLRDIGGPPKPFSLQRPLRKTGGDFGDCLVGDFSDLEREAMYQLTAAGERSVPFFIRPDAWRRTLPKAVGYYRVQRCGADVPNVHALCHTDDARRRDTGQHVDVSGGWHDAGDLRKWMTATMLNGFALLYLARNLGEAWDLAGSGIDPILEEIRWGNRYFLKMQDTDGRVWADTAGGLNGDNSDNHWTDNQVGTADDRYINPSKNGTVQAMFVALQALTAQAFKEKNAEYAKTCLGAAERCWKAASRGAGTQELAWWTLAALEMHRAARQESYAAEAEALGNRLAALQVTEYPAGQQQVRGMFRTSAGSATFYGDAVNSALPVWVLLELAGVYPDHKSATRWRDAVRMHLDDYVLPLAARSAYRIVPFGVFTGSPTPELYRPLAGGLTYRYFLPVRKQFWWLGTTAHLECYALLLGSAARAFGKSEYRDLAYRQLEWVLGANPFAASLMTGEGMRNPYPHSRYVGLIQGGIMNGIAGNAQDEPVLDTEYGYDWRTTEYWSPHNAYYIWALSVLEKNA